MSESVEVVTSELHQAAGRLHASGQRLQDGLSAVDLETSNLLAAGWKGEAATAFQKYWDQWHNGAGQVVRALQAMSEALDAAAKNYETTDEQAGGALGSTMQGGGGSGSGTGGGAPSGGGASTGGVAPSGGGVPSGGAAPSMSEGAGQPSAGVGTGGSTGSSSGLADQMNLGAAIAPLSQAAGIPAQLAGQVAGGLTQAGTMAAGAAQQAVQMAMQMAEQAESISDSATEPEKSEPESEAGPEKASGAAPLEGPSDDGPAAPKPRELR